jgi:hypothetical protein
MNPHDASPHRVLVQQIVKYQNIKVLKFTNIKRRYHD